ncbi:sensor histidine kinase [Lacinutrix chionoecetis]
MNTSKLRSILYFIVFVIVSTIAIQVYWNYKNYQTNKQQLINDVQVSLDNAVDTYYEGLAQKNTKGFLLNSTKHNHNINAKKGLTTIITDTDFKNLDSINSDIINKISIFKGERADSLFTSMHDNLSRATQWEIENDSLRESSIATLTSKVFISITNDSLRLKAIDSLVDIELNRKFLNLDYGITFKEVGKDLQVYKAPDELKNGLTTASKSTFLPQESVLSIYFKNEIKVILKRIFGGILISSLLVLAVITCLFYLLKIINKQKQLAEVKNDLINNITHEFKTPIATIGVALESIKDFNVLDDKVKTKKYLNLSTTQLTKLNIMVEKLLETATLDSENLKLNKQPIDLALMVSNIVEKSKIHTGDKSLKFNDSTKAIIANIDIFHFENAINNIIDNAIKYGGHAISVSIKKKNKHIELLISDNGKKLNKQQALQIFDKFYRVPKGNTHDVKGYGIGLYYTKKIIEKHNGSISVSINNGTAFKIMIPHE